MMSQSQDLFHEKSPNVWEIQGSGNPKLASRQDSSEIRNNPEARVSDLIIKVFK